MSEVIRAIEAAVRAAPDSIPLRLHLAELLLGEGRLEPAIAELGAVLGRDPLNAAAQAMLRRAIEPAQSPAGAADAAFGGEARPGGGPSKAEAADSAEATAPGPGSAPGVDGVDWHRLEREIGIDVAPPFVTDGTGAPAVAGIPSRPGAENEGSESEGSGGDGGPGAGPDAPPEQIVIRDGEDAKFFEEPQPEKLTLADVGGLDAVKERLRLAFLEPMRNPEIAQAYGKSLRGGLLLYGPPGTGKTFLARAVAGELDARFLSITIADILDGVMGESEKNVRRIFERARELAPCVLFIDELDSLGGKRSGYSNLGWMRNVVNQMLQEMDGVGSDNDGVFILAATNHPWDVDNALLRPGRFDRVVLVTAPDAPARAAILKHALRERPIAGIDLDELVAGTRGFSGADLTHVAATAAEKAMSDSIESGRLRPIGMDDMRAALAEIKPSIGPWLQSARNVVDFANADGRYDELKLYLEGESKQQKPKKQR